MGRRTFLHPLAHPKIKQIPDPIHGQPGVLEMVGRSLIRSGEIVFLIDHKNTGQ